jgi:hypothetical protein
MALTRGLDRLSPWGKVDSRCLSVDRRVVLRAGCAEVILNEVRLRSNLWELIPLDTAGRFPAPSPADQDRQ